MHSDSSGITGPVAESAYGHLVEDIGKILENARRQAARSINSTLTSAYWSIGRRIVLFEQSGKVKATYGEGLIERLSRDLAQRFGRGFDCHNVRMMRKFYIQGKWATVSPESGGPVPPSYPLAWSHYRLLMALQDDANREFYERECIQGGWSVRQLKRQMQSMLFERMAMSRNKRAVLGRARNERMASSAEDEIKDPYILDFLDIKDDYSESELEDALIRHLEDFLLELGIGFAFVARQRTLIIGDERFKVDLVLYHMGLHCLVLIDLKTGKFSHADAGQMNFYLNYFKDKDANPGDNPPVGIILCADKNDTVVKYALGGMQNRIFASRYRLSLPPEAVLRDELLKEKGRFLERAATGSGHKTSKDADE
jgi:predicted nuclease of restriction endonuclease-like (RecB) superfamily